MTGRERILNHLAGKSVGRLPVMPITMMFACAQIGARYRDYCTDYRVLVEGQMRTAEKFGFDYVNTMSDPAREAADLRGINTLMTDFFDDPGFVRDLFAFVVEMELRFAREQMTGRRRAQGEALASRQAAKAVTSHRTPNLWRRAPVRLRWQSVRRCKTAAAA